MTLAPSARNRMPSAPALGPLHDKTPRPTSRRPLKSHLQPRARAVALPAAVLLCIIAGAVLGLVLPGSRLGPTLWSVGLVLTGAPVVWRTLRGLGAGRFAADVTATLAIVTAALLEQPLAGLIVVLMQSGGEALERYAAGRASDAVRELEDAAPRVAHRVAPGGIEDVDTEAIRVGDAILVRPGELIPCDGTVIEGRSHVDTSRLTGEPVPVSAHPGARLMSGSLNGEGAITMRATAASRESQYARIVELVRSAQASKSPLQRLADRYAVWFTPVTLAVCLTVYLLTGDALRVLAVLVVATPCPLILATPVAIIGGINRAARRQIIVRHGGALEQLARVTVAAFDKTGTLTVGQPQVSRISTAAGFTERDVLRLAGAVEQRSSHLLARTLVAAASARGIALPPATAVNEAPGRGVEGTVEGRRIIVGARSFVAERAPAALDPLAELERQPRGLQAWVAIDGRGAAVVEYADRVRPNVRHTLEELERVGVERIILLSGDRAEHTRAVADATGIQEAVGDLLPEGKVRIVKDLVAHGDSVVMVGDGTNDAPALSSATVGIALAAHGGGITAEAGDVVVLTDDLSRVVDAIRISRRTIRIARQSIWVGLGLSIVAMIFAAFGMIPPTLGALLQEAIDVAVILNALRAARPDTSGPARCRRQVSPDWPILDLPSSSGSCPTALPHDTP